MSYSACQVGPTLSYWFPPTRSGSLAQRRPSTRRPCGGDSWRRPAPRLGCRLQSRTRRCRSHQVGLSRAPSAHPRPAPLRASHAHQALKPHAAQKPSTLMPPRSPKASCATRALGVSLRCGLSEMRAPRLPLSPSACSAAAPTARGALMCGRPHQTASKYPVAHVK
jgi:hypothetical protein